MTKLNTGIAGIALAMLAISHAASAADLLQKDACSLQTPGRAPVHTQCLVRGGMSNGAVDVNVTTPDNASHALFGYLDRRDGWQLDHAAARQTSQTLGKLPFCVRSLNGRLELCLEQHED